MGPRAQIGGRRFRPGQTFPGRAGEGGVSSRNVAGTDERSGAMRRHDEIVVSERNPCGVSYRLK